MTGTGAWPETRISHEKPDTFHRGIGIYREQTLSGICWGNIRNTGSLTLISLHMQETKITSGTLRKSELFICKRRYLRQGRSRNVMHKVDLVVHFGSGKPCWPFDRRWVGISSRQMCLEHSHFLDSALPQQDKKFVHISTDEVYGSRIEGSFKETDIFNASSPYSSSKAASFYVPDCRSHIISLMDSR